MRPNNSTLAIGKESRKRDGSWKVGGRVGEGSRARNCTKNVAGSTITRLIAGQAYLDTAPKAGKIRGEEDISRAFQTERGHGRGCTERAEYEEILSMTEQIIAAGV